MSLSPANIRLAAATAPILIFFTLPIAYLVSVSFKTKTTC